MKLTRKQRCQFPRIQRKYPVSVEFLKQNKDKIWNFYCYALCPRLIIKTIAIRKKRTQCVVIRYHHLRRVLFDQTQRKRIKARKRSVQQWSRAMVCYLKSTYGIEEYVESVYENRTEVEWINSQPKEVEVVVAAEQQKEEESVASSTQMAPEEISKQLKEQLALLRSGKRKMTLIEGSGDEIRRAAGGEEIKTVAKKPNTSTTEAEDEANVANKCKQVSEGLTSEVTEVTDVREHITDSDSINILKPAAKKTDLAIESSHNNITDDVKEKEKEKKNQEEKKNQKENEEEKEIAIGDGEHFPNVSKVIEITEPTGNPEMRDQEENKLEAPVLDSASLDDKTKPTTNFLDMLMNKVRVRNFSELVQPSEYLASPEDELHASSLPSPTREIAAAETANGSTTYHHENDHSHSTDSSEEFLGFEDTATERIPGMLQTPIVPCRSKSKSGATSSAFISESLNEYMRENNLHETIDSGDGGNGHDEIFDDTSNTAPPPRHRQSFNLDGLVTPGCTTPYMQMPAVPESLQRLRTVAERRQYLQRFAKNHKMAIINNEATIYRELQRKMVHHKSKSVAQQLAQAPNSQMPFTRNGWQAASFCATEFNKYYYQMLSVDNNRECVKLPGVRGNNEDGNKCAYTSRVGILAPDISCSESCADFLAWRDFKAIKTYTHKSKLNRAPLPAVFRPCPLSFKPLQRPLDDDTAALLLAGGSMAVVRMPTVELQVYPELGKPLHEIAKRYLQHILPHHDISREWAEFSVSTLQQPAARTMSAAAEEAAAAAVVASGRRKSFTFAIPYLNDRQHILVRRVVDRSEKLDQSFEQAQTGEEPSATTLSHGVSMADFSFRSNLDESDDLIMECADVLGDMINSVAISCSENSFIKEDPHSLYAKKTTPDDAKPKKAASAAPHNPTEKPEGKQVTASTSSAVQTAQHKKQNRLLCELRRLNATIIDANAKSEKEAKPCSKEYCALGCVCTSIADDYPLRQHCGKSKCVIECTCKGLNQSRIMRLETDGRSITTEDAFMLRRKATARLARMEKEFTSTIVLTENETLLINESQYDKKRRCTKAPKRYEDFADTDDDFTRSPPKKSSSAVVTIEASEALSSSNGFAEVATELREPIYVKDTTLDQLKHCTVSLVPFEEVKNMAVWCMVHELYKCYCGGRSTEGKALFIEKEEVNTTTALTTNNEANSTVDTGYVTMPTTKARYSFEKLEDEDKEELNESEPFILPEKHLSLNNEEPTDEEEVVEEEVEEEEEEQNYTDEESEDPSSVEDDIEADPDVNLFKHKKRGRPLKHTVAPNNPKNPNKKHKRGRPFTADIIQDYFEEKPNSCRRAVSIPHKTYARLNRSRLPKIHDFIATNEDAKTRLLLNEHILRSVYYHKHELEKKQRKEDHNLLKHEKNKKSSEDKQIEKKAVLVKTEQVVELFDEESRQSTVASSITSSEQSPKCSRKRLRPRTEKSVEKNKSPEKDKSSEKNKSPEKNNPIERHIERDSSGRFSTSANDEKFSQKSLLYRLVRDHKFTEDTGSTTPTSLSSSPLNEKSPCSHIDTANIQYPKISGCFSLNDNDENVNNQLQDAISCNSPTPSSSQSISVSADINDSSSTRSTAKALGLEDANISNENFKEFYNGVIKNMNNLVSKKMQDIDMALKRKSKIIPVPNSEILCIIKWSIFLDAFNQGFVYIWEVKMKDDHSFFAATITNMMPMILGAVGVVNIAAMDAKKLPLMGRMLLECHRSEQTWKLAIVMQGRTKYWLVKGFLRPDVSSACAKPTPQTHPVLTQKINVLCSLLVKQRIKEYHRKLQQQKQDEDAAKLVQNRPLVARAIPPLVAPISPTIRQLPPLAPPPPPPPQVISRTSSSTSINTGVPATTLLPPPLNKRQIALNQEFLNNNETLSKKLKPQIPPQQLVPPTMVTTTPTTKVPHKPTWRRQKQKSRGGDGGQVKASLLPNMAASLSSSSPSNCELLRELTTAQSGEYPMKTNIEFRKVTKDDIQEIYQPEFHAGDHRWLVLDLFNDFSHIFVPDFNDLVSLDRIHKVMSFSRLKEKIVKLQFFQNAPFDAFVTPSSSRKIYFGPLKLNMRPPLLILLQSVDGKMMCREIYQQQHNIPNKPNECTTTAFWILQINGQTHFEIDEMETGNVPTPPLVPIQAVPVSVPQQQHQEQPSCIEDPDSDEDCMIVEENRTSAERRSSEDLGQLLPNSSNDESSMEPAAFPPNSSLENCFTNTDYQSQAMSSSQRINFTIESKANDGGRLQITPIPNNDTTGGAVVQQAQSTPLIPEQFNSLLSQPTTTTVQSGSILHLPANVSQQAAGFLPILNLPTSAVITSTEPAPKDAPYGSTIYISNVNSSDTTMEQSSSHSTVKPITIYSNDFGTVSTPAVYHPPLKSSNPNQTCTRTSIGGDPTSLTTTVAPIKQRRVSLRCPTQTNSDTTNIAIDTVLKQMPKSQEAPTVVVEDEPKKEVTLELSPPPIAAILPSKLTPVPAATLINPLPKFKNAHISTIGCTTITKLLDTTATPGRTLQTAKLSAILGLTETSKPSALITVAPINNSNISHVSGNVYLNEITGEVEPLPATEEVVQETSNAPVIKIKATRLLMADSNLDDVLKNKRRRVMPILGGRISILENNDSEPTKNMSLVAIANNTSAENNIKFPLTIPTTSKYGGKIQSIQMVEPPVPPVPPMVFDVNFMDGADDEPAASILIKQTSPVKPPVIVSLSLPACTSITAKPTITTAITTTATTTTSSSTTITNTSAVHSFAEAAVGRPFKRNVTGAAKLPTRGGFHVVKTFTATKFSTISGLDADKQINSVPAAPVKLNLNGPQKSTTSKQSADSATVISATSTQTPLSVTLPTAPSASLKAAMLGMDALKDDISKLQQRLSLPATVVVSNNSASPIATTNFTQISKLSPIFNVRSAVPVSRHCGPPVPVKVCLNKSRSDKTPFAVVTKKADNTMATSRVKTSGSERTTVLPRASSSATFANNAATSAKAKEEAEYGYFCCVLPDAPKFVAKRVRNDILIKVPKIGIVRFSGGKPGPINTYLNQHMANRDILFTMQMEWKFVSQERMKAEAGHPEKATNVSKESVGTKKMQNITIRRKINTTSNLTATAQSSTTLAPRTTSTTATTSAKAVANATAAASTNVHSDTILIED